MLKRWKKLLIITGLVTLLPMVWGLLLWSRLPGVMATHWGLDGQANGYSSRYVAVFGIPLILLAFQGLCFFGTARDSRNSRINQKVMTLVLWIIPVISNLVCGMIYATALGWALSPMRGAMLIVGALFLCVGNYLPKCRQNGTVGIKMGWVYTSPENWNATHRFGGKVWVAGGAATVLLAMLPQGKWVAAGLLGILMAVILLPLGYSYRFYRREGRR